MADISTTVSDVFGSIFGGLTGIIFWVLILIVGVSITGGIVIYFVHRRKFDIIVKVISKREGESKTFFDDGAILTDKKNNTDYLKLKNTKVELEIPKFDIFTSTNRGDYVEIYRFSERGFSFLTPSRIDKEYVISSGGKKIPFADIKQRQIESDISWVMGRLRNNKRIIDPESLLLKLLAYAPQIAGMAMMMIILYVVLRYAPQLLQSMADTAEKFDRIARGDTEVIGGLLLLVRSIWKKKI